MSLLAVAAVSGVSGGKTRSVRSRVSAENE